MKRFTLTLVLSLGLWQPLCATIRAAPAPADPVAENLFDPELILNHGEAIGLTEISGNSS